MGTQTLNRVLLGALGALSLTACGTDTVGEPADALKTNAAAQPPSLAGKADVGQRVSLRGELALGSDQPGEFTADLQFDAYPITVRAGAVIDVEITQRGTTRALDPTLFIYGPLRDGEYGDAALAYDDDAGWGPYPRLRGLRLEAGGQYLVVVGTHDARGRGRYNLRADCPGGDCAVAPEPLPDTCPPSVAAGVRACVADQLSDPDAPFGSAAEAREACLDAEPLARGYDAACAAGEPAGCGLPYFEVWAPLAQACREALAGDDAPTGECLLGSVYRDHRTMPGLVVVSSTKLYGPDGLDTVTADQILDAVRQSAWSDVPDVATAFGAVDQREVNRTELYDVSNQQGLVVYEYGAGDNSYGAYYLLNAATRVANIHDGDIENCRVFRGPFGGLCDGDSVCAGALTCVGRSAERTQGRCLEANPPAISGDGQGCDAQTPCPAGAGLVCAGISRGAGLCGPAWMRETFVDATSSVVADGMLTRTLSVTGLASADTDVWLSGTLIGEPGGRLRVTLENPSENEVLVFDGDFEGWFDFGDVTIRGFSGDESVNGSWILRIVGAEGAALEGWRLTVGSRWD